VGSAMRTWSSGVVSWILCSALGAACAAGGDGGKAAGAAPTPITAAAAGADGGGVVIGERMVLRSQVLGEARTLLIYRPPPERPDSRYPVVYLLDGEAHFHHVTGLVQFLMQTGRMPRVIVVGVANVDRTRDFTPTHVSEADTSGGADRFLVFLAKELIPAVEAAYPTARYRVLIGHSLGGLFAIHALNQMPDLFDATIGISPSLAWVGDPIRQRTESVLATRPAFDRVLYFAVGKEPDDMTGSNRAYARMLTARAPRGFRWLFEEMPAEDHGSIVHRAVYRGLEHVFAGWGPPAAPASLAEVEAHYAALSARFRMTVVVPEDALNALGYRLLAAGQVDQGVAALRRNSELHPESANVHDSLGEALERKGDLAGAVKSHEMAVKNAALNGDPRLQTYKDRLDRAREKAKTR